MLKMEFLSNKQKRNVICKKIEFIKSKAGLIGRYAPFSFFFYPILSDVLKMQAALKATQQFHRPALPPLIFFKSSQASKAATSAPCFPFSWIFFNFYISHGCVAAPRRCDAFLFTCRAPRVLSSLFPSRFA